MMRMLGARWITYPGSQRRWQGVLGQWSCPRRVRQWAPARTSYIRLARQSGGKKTSQGIKFIGSGGKEGAAGAAPQKWCNPKKFPPRAPCQSTVCSSTNLSKVACPGNLKKNDIISSSNFLFCPHLLTLTKKTLLFCLKQRNWTLTSC